MTAAILFETDEDRDLYVEGFAKGYDQALADLRALAAQSPALNGRGLAALLAVALRRKWNVA